MQLFSSDVDANELASDNAETALSGRITTLEADPTTAAAVTAVQNDVNQNEADADAAILVNTNSIAANDFFDQTGVKLAVGAGKTWTELEAATGTFTSSASAGTLTLAAGSITDSNGAVDFGDDHLSTTGTLDAGATTLGSTLDVAGAGEFDSSLGVDGNLRVGTGGASTFQVNSTSGALSTSGDISTTGGVQSTSLIATGTALLQGTTTASTLSVSNFLTLNNEPLLDSHAATKLYVDSRPQAYSFDQTGGNYQTNSDRLNITESNDFTLTISGASLAGATSYKLHYKGGEATLTLVSSTATTATLTLTDTAVTTLVGSDTEGQMMLSIDGAGTGLYVKF